MKTEELCKKIDEYILKHKQEIICFVSLQLRENRTKFINYKWEHDGCPYDTSGRIYEDGYIDIANMSMEKFSEECYTGKSTATYLSGMGLYWNTYGDELCEWFYDIAIYFERLAILRAFENEQQMTDFCKENDYPYENEIDSLVTSIIEIMYGEGTVADNLWTMPLDVFTEIKEMSVADFIKVSDDVYKSLENDGTCLAVSNFMETYKRINKEDL